MKNGLINGPFFFCSLQKIAKAFFLLNLGEDIKLLKIQQFVNLLL